MSTRPARDKPIGLAIIGAGSIVRWAHIPALQYLDGFQLQGLCNSNPQSTRAAAERYRTKGFDRPDELLGDSTIEAVLIATPPAHHEAMMRGALSAGKHVFCESPATVNSSAAGRELEALAAAKGLVIQVGHCFRYSPLIDLLNEHLRDATGPRLWAFEYFPFLSHIYDLALYLCGPFERVVGSVETPAGSATTLAFKNGDTAVVVGRSIVNCALDIESIRVSTANFFGAVEGRRRVRIAKHLKAVPFDQWSTREAEGLSYEAQAGGRLTLEVSGYIPQLRGFAEAIRAGVRPRCTLADTLEAAEMGEVIVRAQPAEIG